VLANIELCVRLLRTSGSQGSLPFAIGLLMLDMTLRDLERVLYLQTTLVDRTRV